MLRIGGLVVGGVRKKRLDFAVGVGACACKSQKQMPPLSDDPRDIYLYYYRNGQLMCFSPY